MKRIINFLSFILSVTFLVIAVYGQTHLKESPAGIFAYGNGPVSYVDYKNLIPLSLEEQPLKFNYKEYQRTLTRKNFMSTSGDKENYAEFTIRDNIIYIKGRYKDGAPVDIYFSGGTMTGYKKSLNSKPDGSFTAALSGTPTEDYLKIIIRLPPDDYLIYRIEYDGGWFFGDNGLADKGAEALLNSIAMNPDITAVLINHKADHEEIRSTLNEIKNIAQKVTAGITDDYQKAKALSRWISENFYYDVDASKNVLTPANIALSEVLKTSRTLCAGFSGLYGALLEAVGIEALTLKGGVAVQNGIGGQSCSYEELPYITLVHEFTAFWYENENRWVYADVGWDRNSRYENGNYHKFYRTIKHFDISPLALSQDHRIDSAVSHKYFTVLDYFERQADGPEYEKPSTTAPESAKTPKNSKTPEISDKASETTEISDKASQTVEISETSDIFESSGSDIKIMSESFSETYPEAAPSSTAQPSARDLIIDEPPPKPEQTNAPLYAIAVVLGALVIIAGSVVIKNKFKNQ